MGCGFFWCFYLHAVSAGCFWGATALCPSRSGAAQGVPWGAEASRWRHCTGQCGPARENGIRECPLPGMWEYPTPGIGEYPQPRCGKILHWGCGNILHQGYGNSHIQHVGRAYTRDVGISTGDVGIFYTGNMRISNTEYVGLSTLGVWEYPTLGI